MRPHFRSLLVEGVGVASSRSEKWASREGKQLSSLIKPLVSFGVVWEVGVDAAVIKKHLLKEAVKQLSYSEPLGAEKLRGTQ